MSDIAQGPDWWQGTDGKWYPPAAPAGFAPGPPGPPLRPGPPGAPGVPGAPGTYGAMPPPGGMPGQQPVYVVQKKSNTGLILGLLAVFLVIPVIAVVCIAAVTLLGRSASSKFVSVAPTISVVAPAPPAG